MIGLYKTNESEASPFEWVPSTALSCPMEAIEPDVRSWASVSASDSWRGNATGSRTVEIVCSSCALSHISSNCSIYTELTWAVRCEESSTVLLCSKCTLSPSSLLRMEYTRMVLGLACTLSGGCHTGHPVIYCLMWYLPISIYLRSSRSFSSQNYLPSFVPWLIQNNGTNVVRYFHRERSCPT